MQSDPLWSDFSIQERYEGLKQGSCSGNGKEGAHVRSGKKVHDNSGSQISTIIRFSVEVLCIYFRMQIPTAYL